jgi:hypothetical protein
MRRGTQSTPFSATFAKTSAASAVSFVYLSPPNRVSTQAVKCWAIFAQSATRTYFCEYSFRFNHDFSHRQ